MDRLLKKCIIKSELVRECLAEFFGVYVLILFGCGSVAQVTTSENTKGEYLSINLGFALGTTFGIYISKGVSGAHLNPAVSLSLCFLGRFSWTRLPFYIFSQIFGAFLAAATVALQYYDAIFHYSRGHLTVNGATATAGIFSTYPAEYLSMWGGVVDQVIGTAALLVCVLALNDRQNTPAPPGLEPVLVGAVVMVIGISMGSNSGYAINPARDLGPRVFSFIAGWGDEVFSFCMNTFGNIVYQLVIGVHHPEPETMKAEDDWQESNLKAVQQDTVIPKEVVQVYREEAI
ncbi:aquaporin-10b [Hoplias malabaricus]|uniref:aquaporin-10b n=1 Tax=Hoplias malabaricus TaxID=27720 RepID=UPI0034624184